MLTGTGVGLSVYADHGFKILLFVDFSLKVGESFLGATNFGNHKP